MRFTRIKIATFAAVLAVAAFVCWPVPTHRTVAPRPYSEAIDLAPRLSLMDSALGILHAQGLSATNPYNYWVPPGACFSTVSGNSTGTNGLTSAGTSFTPVIQGQTSGSGTNTHNFVCNITPPSVLITTGTGLQIISADFMYGVQTTGLGTQVCVPASGTWNAVTVFGTITYPTPAGSETPTTVAPVRADSGTLGMTPACGSANVATTTAGAFVSQRFTPAAGTLPFKTDSVQLLMSVALLNTATSATITNSPGVLVRYRSQ